MANATVAAYAPGRVELLGNHTDYNEGLVLAAAIDRGLTVRGSTVHGSISLESASMGSATISLSDLKPQKGETRWANYALGVAAELIARGIPLEGFCAQIEGDLPRGNGLSSSAAFEVATALLVLELCHSHLPRIEIAKVCQRAEHTFVGVQSGLLDQVTSIFGQADHVVCFDARSEEVRVIPFPPDLALIVAQSNTPRELADGKYNERRRETAAAARALNVRALRDVSMTDLESRPNMDATLRRRATHVVGENERVARAIEALARDDAADFGALMNASHESSRTNFQNSTPQLDLLVDLARSLPGVFGSRLTGGGFGGATVTLCRRDKSDDIAARLRDAPQTGSAVARSVFLCNVADGARLIPL
jgi:galactokinase